MGERYDKERELAAFAEFVADADREPVVVVAGCGAGATVESLREYDVAAYGFDASQSILETAAPSTREWLLEADIRDEDLVTSLREAFGIDEIDIFVTECMLSFLDVDEATAALARIRETNGVGVVLHLVRIDPPVAAQEGEIDATILPPAEWQAACDPDGADIWRDALERLDLPPSETGDDGGT
ncbi:methyltransferase domain-containing protein [Natrinema sp. SYSU A 869]|uniref:methyltransferase domain-containing protein n=1 Tax=Natrinema sp. SYSU A 869 TaxID=2871694 RepID=UPI001CA44273|nr:methyltransferase domain-containing protein [Natrinema sp. SYSU A 869]